MVRLASRAIQINSQHDFLVSPSYARVNAAEYPKTPQHDRLHRQHVPSFRAAQFYKRYIGSLIFHFPFIDLMTK